MFQWYDNLFVIVKLQDEIMSPSGQVEPPGMHMIYLPYSDDIRHIEEVIVLLFTFLIADFSIVNIIGDLQLHTDTTHLTPRATEDQIKSATSLVKRIDLKNFSVCQFANPGNFCFVDNHMEHECALLYLMSIARVMENQYFGRQYILGLISCFRQLFSRTIRSLAVHNDVAHRIPAWLHQCPRRHKYRLMRSE